MLAHRKKSLSQKKRGIVQLFFLPNQKILITADQVHLKKMIKPRYIFPSKKKIINQSYKKAVLHLRKKVFKKNLCKTTP